MSVEETSQGSSRVEAPKQTGLRVLFLSSDTGGGHRASAESLARQFELLYPGSTYDLLDVMSKDGVPPYNVRNNPQTSYRYYMLFYLTSNIVSVNMDLLGTC